MMASVSGVQPNYKAIVVIAVVLIGAIYLFYSSGKPTKSVFTQYDASSWKSSALVKIPQEVKEKAKDVKIKETTLSFTSDGKTYEVFYREAGRDARKSDIPILLLHGAGSSSAVWLKINGLKLYAAMGYHVVALDLPGWAKSKGTTIDNDPKMRAEFLHAFLRQKRMQRPIIVAPSMSGSFSIPYMMQPRPESCESRMRGFVPIAPTHTDLYTHAEYHRCDIPTMIVYGEKDKTLGLTSVGNLRNLPKSEIFMQTQAGHACEEEKPEEFHVFFYNFLRGVERENSF
ncbi:hypothetical protein CAPTEDRAFT_182653 [Capitella teleta]|uniref:Protein ABHD14A n=1 Tax=Capitella teleta TaxID=283909 RepID=R7UMK7_CAPTE|nr:hypothetical protein CAPTEDRAFT_182653 [Capitella teleta]|eukprot:ELU05157.1 hypothetical protein CAPTEDRAFT_182653 [Capitella teleta]